ncbi:MAG: RNA polymerase sigma factor [Sulfurifustis sp.]
MQKHPSSGSASHGQSDFERLLRPHLDYLYKIAYRFTGATDRADDLIQDLLVRLYPRVAELAKVEQPRPWLVRVMYRLFIDQMRRDARQAHVAIAESEFAADEENGDPYAEIANPAPGPDAEFDLTLDRQRLTRAWEQLSPEHRVLLALYEVEGYTLDELETMLDVAPGTLKSRLHRARRRLADLLTVEPFARGRRVRSGSTK